MTYPPYPPQSNPPAPQPQPGAPPPPSGYPQPQWQGYYGYPPAPPQPPPPKRKPFDEERFKRLTAILMAVITAVTSLIALAQNDASARSQVASRDAQVHALEATSLRISGTASTSAEYYGAYKRSYLDDNLVWFESARDNDLGMNRYYRLRDRIMYATPLLDPETYLNTDNWYVDFDAYVVDAYYVKALELDEKYLSAALAKQLWDSKVTQYNLFITLNAIALFLLGLSVTISGAGTRVLFSRLGMVVALAVTALGLFTYLTPVKDLREKPGAIEAYARASGLSYRGEDAAAIAEFDKAIQLDPEYARAYRGRGDAYYYENNLAAAIADLEKARQFGDDSFSTAGNLGWYYYKAGRFAEAIQLNREIIAAYPRELWIRFNLAVTLLADGQVQEALKEYSTGMVIAQNWVAEADAKGTPVPETLWWSLRVAPLDLDELIAIIESGEGEPEYRFLKNTEQARLAADEMIYQLRTLEVGLEMEGKMPEGEVTATVSPFEFAEKEYDEEGAFLRYDKSFEWKYGTKRVYALFDYSGFVPGQQVMYRVYLDGGEMRMWRYSEPWPLKAEGKAEKLFRYFDSDDFILNSGEYVVELYVENHLVQRGRFTVLP